MEHTLTQRMNTDSESMYISQSGFTGLSVTAQCGVPQGNIHDKVGHLINIGLCGVSSTISIDYILHSNHLSSNRVSEMCFRSHERESCSVEIMFLCDVWSKWVKEELSMSWDKTLFPHLHPDWPARLHSPLLPDCEGGVLCFIFTFCWVLHPLIKDLLWLFFSTVARTVNMVNAMECYITLYMKRKNFSEPLQDVLWICL